MEELWKHIENSNYSVSNLGNIKNIKNQKIFKLNNKKDIVNIYDNYIIACENNNINKTQMIRCLSHYENRKKIKNFFWITEEEMTK